MTRYFEAQTNNGTVQIADDIKLLRLEQVLTLGDYFARDENVRYRIKDKSDVDYTAHCYDLPVYQNSLLYVCNPTDTPAHVFTCSSVNVFDLHDFKITPIGLKTVVVVSNIEKSIADTFKVYVFGESVLPYCHCGIECYNENGDKVFNSDAKVLKLLNITNFKHFTFTSGADTRNPEGYQYIYKTHSYNGKTIGMWINLTSVAQWVGHYRDGFWALPILTKNSLTVTMADATYNLEANRSGYFKAAAKHFEEENYTMYSIADLTNY